jgi:hypothetical protein
MRKQIVPHRIGFRTHLPRPDVPANVLVFLLTGFGVPTRAQSVKREARNESFKNLKISFHLRPRRLPLSAR